MKTPILILLLPFLCALSTFSQDKKKVNYAVFGSVCDYVTHENIYGVKAEILTTDSVCLFESVNSAQQGVFDLKGPFVLLLEKSGNYILRFSKKGYETLCVNWYVEKLRKAEPTMRHSPVYLSRKPKSQQLNEAVVKATKIKFYAKGDTLVFNADAFQLAEGSMLDALIRQLPGVELKEDGRILVNGKYVESLLLNGEDFFKKDHSIMLENLPTYMVKTVNVYKKDGKLSEMLGVKTGDDKYVMDVRLKKQYSIGWMANAETAAGTKDRYLARIFALRFTNNSRLSFFGSLNNVNEYNKPGVGSEWIPSVGSGLNITKHGGVEYMINDRNKRFKLEGNAEIRHNNERYDQRTNSETFLDGGNTYGLSTYSNRTNNLSAQTYHNIDLMWNKVKVNIKPSLSYTKTDQNTDSKSGVFAQKMKGKLNTETLDSLFNPYTSKPLLSSTLNRYRKTEKYNGYAISTGVNTQIVLSLPHTNDKVVAEINGGYAYSNYNRFAHKLYDYPTDATMKRDFRNEYASTPYRAYSYSAKASYWHFVYNNWQLQPYYEYRFNHTKQESTLMRLDRVDGWGDDTQELLGTLPSVYEWEKQAFDGKNSLYATQEDNHHTAGLYIHKETFRENYWCWTFNLPISFDHSKLDYSRPETVDTIVKRKRIFFHPSFQGSNTWYVKDKDGRIFIMHELSFDYTIRANAQPLSYSVRIYDDSNPLAVYISKGDLKDSWTHSINAAYKWNNTDKQRICGIKAGYSITQDALAMGYIYEKATGIRTITPDNVNGNWSINGDFHYSTPIDKARKLMMNLKTNTVFNHNVDLIGIDKITVRSTVKTMFLTQGVRFDYRLSKKYQFGVRGNGIWTNATSRREDFTTVNAADFNYGLTAQIEMPWSMQLSTDFTVYSRRGYDESSMNTDDLVWNARLSKRVMKGNLTFIVDGFDILGNLSNVTRTINAQGKTETYRNVIPSYIMLHAIYRLNIKPKKRSGE